MSAAASEYAVIGALLLDASGINRVAAFLCAADFTDEHCALLFERAAGDPAGFDAASAVDALSGAMEREAAVSFVRGCLDLSPTKAALESHAHAVHNDARFRALRNAARDALAEAADGEALAERLAGLGQAHLAAGEKGASALTSALAGLMNGMEGDASARIDTGFTRLDAVLKGLYPGQLVILGARPGVGKSAFALAVALNAARNYGKTLFFSLEMTAQEIAERAVLSYSDVPMDTFLDGSAAKRMNEIADAAGALSRLPLLLDDGAALTVQQLRSRVRQHPDARLVVVDYLGLMAAARRDGNRNLELGELTRGLKNFAAEAGIPIIALSQLNRGVSDTERPTLRSLRDSGELEQHASKVMLLWRTAQGLVACDVAKNRRGRTGVVQFSFDGAHMRFAESPLAYEETASPRRAGKSFLDGVAG